MCSFCKIQVPSLRYFITWKHAVQYMEVKQNVEPAFLKNHTWKFSEILHSGFS